MFFVLQALQIDDISLKFLNVTEQIEDALSHIPYNKLDISEEVREQVHHLAITFNGYTRFPFCFTENLYIVGFFLD